MQIFFKQQNFFFFVTSYINMFSPGQVWICTNAPRSGKSWRIQSFTFLYWLLCTLGNYIFSKHTIWSYCNVSQLRRSIVFFRNNCGTYRNIGKDNTYCWYNEVNIHIFIVFKCSIIGCLNLDSRTLRARLLWHLNGPSLPPGANS